MWILYGLLIAMLFGAVSVLAIPFAFKNKTLLSKPFFAWSVALVLFSFALYRYMGDHDALTFWLSEGQQHYLLQQKIADLGGIESVIEQVKKKLESHPSKEGWVILGKLYQSQEQEDKAADAFAKAKELDALR